MHYFRATLTARFWLITLFLGLVLALIAYGVAVGRYFDKPVTFHPAIPTSPTIGMKTQIPYWLGIYNERLWDRAPIYYCLTGVGWSQDDRDAAYDGLATAWGWAKVNRTIAVQIQERCDEEARLNVLFVMDSAFVQTYCQPNVGFTVVACVSFEDWIYRDGLWMYSKAIIHVEPYQWARASHAWRALIIIHEFGHAAFSLDDTPLQQPGDTAMDYCYEVSYGLPPYPTGLDVDVVNELHGPYKDPAWYCGLGGCPVRN